LSARNGDHLVPLSSWGMLTTASIEYTPEFRFTLLLLMPA
jgi:hypothetical protein